MVEPLRPVLEFTQSDFNIYMAKMAPYSTVIEEGGMLSEEGIESLKHIEDEILEKYGPKSAEKLGIFGHIDGLLSIDNIRKGSKRETELDNERRDLEIRLNKGMADCTLSSEEKERMSRRRDEICYFLDPAHFHGPAPY